MAIILSDYCVEQPYGEHWRYCIACDNTFAGKGELGSHDNHLRLGVIMLIHVMAGVATLVLIATMELDNIK